MKRGPNAVHAVASAALAMLAACSSPSPSYVGIEPVPVSVDAHRFDVYVKEDTAQAIRLSRGWGASEDEVFASASEAIEIASGCAVPASRLSGDVNVINAADLCDR